MMPDGQEVRRFTLTNAHGMIARIINYGATITELWVPSQRRGPTNIVHGFDTFHSYLHGHPYFGCVVGRYANRIANGEFVLDGTRFSVDQNEGSNHLHGGTQGFDKRFWNANGGVDGDMAYVRMSLCSIEGDQGYPGTLHAAVSYYLSDNNELEIEYMASCDRQTIVNLTNHSYFNLSGSGDILDHELTIFADQYTPTDESLIPTGEILPVSDTCLDFTTARRIGERIGELEPIPGGYDHNFVLRDYDGSLRLAAIAHEPRTGRRMEVLTTEPGVQLYTGNHLDGSLVGINGVRYVRHSGFCLETQHFPNSPNHPNFPSTILRPGETFQSTTVFRFPL